MLVSFLLLVHKYKFQGIVLFLQLYVFRKNYIIIPTTNHKLYLRHRTSDLNLFLQIFVKDQYNLKLVNPKVIVDLGANVGLTSVYLKFKYPGVRIIAVEPDKDNFELMKKNLEGFPDIYMLNKGIGGETGKAILIPGEAWSIRTQRVGNSFNGKEIIVELISMIDLINQFHLEEIDLLKIDIEGAELDLFNNDSTSKWLGIARSICIELHDYIAPGASKIFFKRLNDTYENYSLHVKSSNIIIDNLKNQVL